MGRARRKAAPRPVGPRLRPADIDAQHREAAAYMACRAQDAADAAEYAYWSDSDPGHVATVAGMCAADIWPADPATLAERAEDIATLAEYRDMLTR